MKSLKLAVSALAFAAFTSCIDSQDAQVEFYPEKQVTLNTVTVFSQSETPFARLLNQPEFPEYVHEIPSEFNVYFIATNGSDQGKVIKKFENMSEGVHQVVVPARPYKVVITNYNMDNEPEKRRDRLPEYSAKLNLYGEANIDYKASSEGSVTITNDYAASMILKNNMIKSIPAINGTPYVVAGDYYLLYLRDQGGAASFTRNTQVNILRTDGGSTHYNHSFTYHSNKIYKFLFNLYSERDGNLKIEVDENILKDTEKHIVVPNL